MVAQEVEFEAGTHTANTVSPILWSALRGLDIEQERQNSSIHLLSTNRAQVESLLLVLGHLNEARAAIQKYMGGKTPSGQASTLLNEMIANAVALRKHFWPKEYRACEALTRMIDVLTRAGHSLSSRS